MNVTEKMMWSTYPLMTQKGAATGFVINRPSTQAHGGVVPVIFTCTHVLDTVGNGPLVIGVRMPDTTGDAQVALIAFSPPKQRGKQHFYVRHPHHDLAAFALHLPEEFAGHAEIHTSLSERSLVHDSRSLHSGLEVSFLGYPEVLPGTEGAFPVLRSGRVASYPVGTSQAHGRFLINADVYPGDSGAPVFMSGRGNHPELVGMVIQRIGPKERTFSHLAVAVDAEVIREVLTLLDASERTPIPATVTPSKKPTR
jgi:hypothetical protein